MTRLTTTLRNAAWLGAMLGLAAPAAAHHSFAMYDPAVIVRLDGTVKDFQWTNPHVLLWVVGVRNPGEAPLLWTVELPTSPGNLSRMGWTKHSLSPGDRVTVELNPLRDGQHGGSFRKLTLQATGQVLAVTLRDSPKPEAPKPEAPKPEAPKPGAPSPQASK